MHFQKHHWIQMVNKGAGQPETVTGCLSHISSEEEHEKEKSLKSLREKKKNLGRQVGQHGLFLIPVKSLLRGLAKR